MEALLFFPTLEHWKEKDREGMSVPLVYLHAQMCLGCESLCASMHIRATVCLHVNTSLEKWICAAMREHGPYVCVREGA